MCVTGYYGYEVEGHYQPFGKEGAHTASVPTHPLLCGAQPL